MTTRDPRRPGEADALPRDEALSRAYREQAARRAGPPAALDARVLAAARQAIATPRRPAPRVPWWRRLMVPVSVAALLLVSGTLTLMVHDEQQQRDAPAAAPRQAPAALPAAPAAAPSVPAPLPRPEAAQPDGKPARASREAPAASTSSNRADAPPAPEGKTRAAAKPVEQSAAQLRKREAPSPGEGTAPKALPQAFPSAAPAAPATPPVPVAPAAPAAAPAMDAASDAATASGAAAGRAVAPAKPANEAGRGARQMREAAQPLPAAPPAAAPPAPVAPAPGGVAAEPAAPARDVLERESRPKLRLERSAAPTPEAWLAEIRALKRAGREAEWREELARLRARYPDFPLPEDLR
ncbi:MAG: hypothetical protein IPL03_11610 [Sterolibacteriaceae bacterium]|nr:hypothetical protein [Candidatus Methylophosphatis haderslevensis]